MEIEKLEKEIRRHNRLYWIENAPVIADEEYDRMVEDLRAQDPNNPVLSEIGAGKDAQGKIAHPTPMLSLDKCYNMEDLLKWMKKAGGMVTVTHKVDGLAAAIRYDRRGDLAVAATRGDGRRGDDITANVTRVAGVPVRIDGTTFPVEIRGEVYMPLETFAAFEGEFANPRNLAAGALKHKDPEETAKYGLHFVAYDLLGTDLQTEMNKLEVLNDWEFQTPPVSVATSADELAKAVSVYTETAKKLDYETDGIVFKVNRVSYQAEMGSTGHHPRYSIAWKFQGESGKSVLREVVWQVSRSGTINPVAVIDPVELSGVTVTRASLHNLAIMDTINTKIGAEVDVTRRGGVIPHIEMCYGGDGEVEPPDCCPSCGGFAYEEGDFLQADHKPECRPVAVGRFLHFLKRVGMKGLGEKHVDKLLELGYIRAHMLMDILVVSVSRLGDVVGAKTALKLDKRRDALVGNVEEAYLLAAFGIPLVGRTVSEKILPAVGGFKKMLECELEDFMKIDGIGLSIADSLYGHIQNHKAEMELMRAKLKPKGVVVEGKFGGEVFLFTGKLEGMKRNEAAKLVKEMGGSVASSASKKVTYVVTNASGVAGKSRSSKMKKAKELGLKVIGEKEFLAMCVQ